MDEQLIDDEDMLNVYDGEDDNEEEDIMPKKNNHIVFVDSKEQGTKIKLDKNMCSFIRVLIIIIISQII